MTKINLFHIDNIYVFKHYFEESDIFEELRDYYNSFEYRFEVKEDEVEDAVEKLEKHGYNVNIVEKRDIPDYTVVIGKYEKHADLLKKSVDVIEVGDKKALVLKDKVAKEEALDRGEEPDEGWETRL
ncbi:hypothetical protein AKJ37_06335 [candidate division MSBL1 archaeon SCGC-AAA259I09]|uniref:Uncharacterized protein n=3 Tax=candidate division MSBL1 TaxID=215777 RepID=A0A133UP49_9EURY|nr:hypothetical protein AKJ37_06335 [candidate division MSBL1 archaeon SCGC-AAA259I09]KXA97984.1 hypothetical protein AKJ39_02670 [candidate division MSBL1 archaeon SCGC-AAA259J03]KXA99519.1 hypothetical protein AKJ40_02950 [candidate division MSBL1 archaeon SCGC-AAA259M10]